MLSAVGGAVELLVDRPYKAGEPIVVWYKYSALFIVHNVDFSFSHALLSKPFPSNYCSICISQYKI